MIEALIKSGALDELGPNRATLLAALPLALQAAEQHNRTVEAGQNDLFGLTAGASENNYGDDELSRYEELPEWNEIQRLSAEKETLGMYLTGHPIDRYEQDLPYLANGRIGALISEGVGNSGNGRGRFGGPQRQVVVVGLVMDIRKRGGRVTTVLDDRTGRIEVTFFEETFNQFRNQITKDSVITVEGRMSFDEFINGYRITAKGVKSIEAARTESLRRMTLSWDASKASEDFVLHLKKILSPYQGGTCPVWVHYKSTSAAVEMPLGDAWRVRPADELISKLEEALGREGIHLFYSHVVHPEAGPIRSAS